MDVGELAVERRDGGRGEQIGGDDPGEALDVRIGAADGRERGRHDGLVERREEHRQHQPEQDAAHGRMIEARGRAGEQSRRMLLKTQKRACAKGAQLRAALVLKMDYSRDEINVLQRNTAMQARAAESASAQNNA